MKYNVIHGGSLGDAIYALPACRRIYEITKEPISLFFTQYPPAHLPEHYIDSIAPLLKLQEYVDEVYYNKILNVTDEYHNIHLQDFRNNYTGENLAVWQMRMAYAKLGISYEHNEELYRPWINDVPKETVAKVIIHRSLRYRNNNFPWKYVVEKFRKDAVIVGNIDGSNEVGDFCNEFGKIPYYKTETLGKLAKIISGAKYFIGNQSTPMALANALGGITVLEEYQDMPNSTFCRKGCLPSKLKQQITEQDIEKL